MGWNDREPAASWIEMRQQMLMETGVEEFSAYLQACDEYAKGDS